MLSGIGISYLRAHIETTEISEFHYRRQGSVSHRRFGNVNKGVGGRLCVDLF